MTLENYVLFYNKELYPLNYPYYLRTGIRAEGKELSLIVQIGIPKEQEEPFDIDNPTEYDFQDILTLYGDTDEEVINLFEKIDFNVDHKEYFKSLWK